MKRYALMKICHTIKTHILKNSKKGLKYNVILVKGYKNGWKVFAVKLLIHYEVISLNSVTYIEKRTKLKIQTMSTKDNNYNLISVKSKNK